MIKYRKRRKYKYTLEEDYSYDTGMELILPVLTTYLEMSVEGKLLIKKGYSWDGPSGPAVDTPDFMRGSLVHDALYQLMRGEYLNPDCREDADLIMLKICREDGMSRFRSRVVYLGVRLFAAWAARPDLKHAP
ncbi:DUF1353 domain-containing protein [Spirochaeta isovalerica]|uniref:DUF1353 domain-containing protein n=1 Tax=Spirochaeta isovalerica TaxID=150 RepID=A0A841RGC7_9SPIO|nr:DUF1353 domain-containing protein [Spirochaeta isovalerica]MBB6481839.1 hypothetical protein [Spirochaeta isovalerica]